MRLVFCWYCDADKDVERALQHDLAEEAARKSQAIEAANRIIESWVLRSGGRILNEDGTKGSAEIQAEYLEDLPDIVKQVEQTTESRFHVGIGAEPSEAMTALKVAEKRGKTTLYTPDLSEEAAEESSEDPLEMSDMSKAQFNEPREKREATRIAEGSLSPNHAMPSGGESASSFNGPKKVDQNGQPVQQPAPGAPQNEDQLMDAIGGVLQDMKAQIPFFEQQVKKANPQAYQAVMGMVEAMVELAKQVAGGGPDKPHPEEGQEPQEGQPQVDNRAEGEEAKKSEYDFLMALEKAMPVKSGAELAGLYRAIKHSAREKIYEALKAQTKTDSPVANVAKRHMAAIDSVRKADDPERGERYSNEQGFEGNCYWCGEPVGGECACDRKKKREAPKPEPKKTELEPPMRLAKPAVKAEVDPDRLATGSAEESEEHSLPPGGKKLTGKDIARDHLEKDPQAYAKAEPQAQGAKPVYLGWFLTPQAREELLKRFPPKHPNVFADHATFQFGPKPEHVSQFAPHLGSLSQAKVSGYAEDAKGQAVLLDMPNPITGSTQRLHITLSTAHDPVKNKPVPPVYSNELISNAANVKPLNEPMSLEGMHDHFPRTTPVAKTTLMEHNARADAYPVGTTHNGKVKVYEPATGQVTDHSQRAGSKGAEHVGGGISARLSGCPSEKTPQNPHPGQGGPTQEARDPTMSDAGKKKVSAT